jgi:hypothetical protein
MAERERLNGAVEVLTTESGPRRFRMVANTGAAFERRYGKTVADLSALTVPKKLPILLNHNENEVVGFADSHELTAEGLVLHGQFVDEPASARVQKLSDSGFPLTASVGVREITKKLVDDGKSARLNGKDFTGPLTVWAKGALFECSVVTANPADMNTTAAALVEETPMTPDEFLKANPEAVKAWKDAAAKAQALADKTRLADLLKAMPAGRERFVLEQYAAGADLLTAKAALADVLMAEASERAKAPKDEAPKDPLLEALKAKADHPGLGFNGNARQGADSVEAEAMSAGVDVESLKAFERHKKHVRSGVIDRAASALGGKE